jgi:hypothetical protein
MLSTLAYTGRSSERYVPHTLNTVSQYTPHPRAGVATSKREAQERASAARAPPQRRELRFIHIQIDILMRQERVISTGMACHTR